MNWLLVVTNISFGVVLVACITHLNRITIRTLYDWIAFSAGAASALGAMLDRDFLPLFLLAIAGIFARHFLVERRELRTPSNDFVSRRFERTQ
jgi:hypothetical protein